MAAPQFSRWRWHSGRYIPRGESRSIGFPVGPATARRARQVIARANRPGHARSSGEIRAAQPVAPAATPTTIGPLAAVPSVPEPSRPRSSHAAAPLRQPPLRLADALEHCQDHPLDAPASRTHHRHRVPQPLMARPARRHRSTRGIRIQRAKPGQNSAQTPTRDAAPIPEAPMSSFRGHSIRLLPVSPRHAA